MRFRVTLFLIAAAALSACASSQFDSKNVQTADATTAPSLDCPDVSKLHAAQLYGRWDVVLVHPGLRGQLTLRQHPESNASLRGQFS